MRTDKEKVPLVSHARKKINDAILLNNETSLNIPENLNKEFKSHSSHALYDNKGNNEALSLTTLQSSTFQHKPLLLNLPLQVLKEKRASNRGRSR